MRRRWARDELQLAVQGRACGAFVHSQHDRRCRPATSAPGLAHVCTSPQSAASPSKAAAAPPMMGPAGRAGPKAYISLFAVPQLDLCGHAGAPRRQVVGARRLHGPRGHARHCMLGSPAPQAQLVRRTMQRRLPEWLLRVWDEEVHVPCVRSFARASAPPAAPIVACLALAVQCSLRSGKARSVCQSCRRGFSGADCRIDVCAAANCGEHGRCVLTTATCAPQRRVLRAR
jgi:hypothetical protein